MVRFHALLVLVLMSRKNFLTQLFLKLLHKSTCFFSTRDLEVVQKREVEIEGIEDLWLDLQLHLRQWRVRVIERLSIISSSPSYSYRR